MVEFNSVVGLKSYYYPSVNISGYRDANIHIKNIETICLLRDFHKDLLYAQLMGKYTSHCTQVLLIPSKDRWYKDRNAMQTLLWWALDNLPENETVLVPASGAGPYSYWSNPDSAVLAKLLLI